MNLEIVRFETATATPWKNGLGTTKQLAIYPADASAAAFEWRVSVAHLTGTAPFSDFPGVERCLAMLEGDITLLREAQPEVTLTPVSAPLAFSGMERIVGRVNSSSALDLNLMYLAARWRGSMQRISLQAGESRTSAALTLLCICKPARLSVAGDIVELGRFDLVRLNVPGTNIVALSATTAYTIELLARRVAWHPRLLPTDDFDDGQ